MATGLIEIMKMASMDAMENKQMCDLRFGTVISVAPLKVQITNQLTIPESLLIVPQHLTDYSVDCIFTRTAKLTTGETLESNGHTHKLEIQTDEGQESTSFIIQNALKIGDKVALLRKQGGQSFFILDRI